MITLKRDTSITFPELRGNIDHIRYPCFVELKYDGEFNVALISPLGKHSLLINKSGKARMDFPIIDDLRSMIDRAELVGELYVMSGKQGEFYDLQKNFKPEELRFVVFDILEYNGENTKEWPLIERKELLAEVITKTAHVRVMPVRIASNKAELLRIIDTAYNAEYEGVVVKNMDGRYITGPCSWVKIKRKDENIYSVSHIDEALERIEVMVGGPMVARPVGLKVSHDLKKTLKIGDLVRVEHQGILSKGGLRHPIFKGKQ